jgi:hypothetical protein
MHLVSSAAFTLLSLNEYCESSTIKISYSYLFRKCFELSFSSLHTSYFTVLLFRSVVLCTIDVCLLLNLVSLCMNYVHSVLLFRSVVLCTIDVCLLLNLVSLCMNYVHSVLLSLINVCFNLFANVILSCYWYLNVTCYMWIAVSVYVFPNLSFLLLFHSTIYMLSWVLLSYVYSMDDLLLNGSLIGLWKLNWIEFYLSIIFYSTFRSFGTLASYSFLQVLFSIILFLLLSTLISNFVFVGIVWVFSVIFGIAMFAVLMLWSVIYWDLSVDDVDGIRNLVVLGFFVIFIVIIELLFFIGFFFVAIFDYLNVSYNSVFILSGGC